jgi:alcohol dehydrogenase class IV
MPQPTEHVGDGCIARLQGIIEQSAAQRVLIVTGRESYRESGAEAALAPYLHGLQVRRFCDFAINPRLEDIERGLAVVREFRPHLVVAIGGGSVLDMAKLINVLAVQAASAADLITGVAVLNGRGVPLVAIPTTAGTGSEATHFAVAYIGETKYSLADPAVLPDYAIVDPALTYRMPPVMTACTGFDALSQAIESFWAVGSSEESRAYSAKAILMLLGALAKAVRAPDAQARRDMSIGAHLAGKAIDIAKTTAAHALSYALTSCYGIPHGHAVALTLGRFFLVHSELDHAQFNGALTKEALRQRMSQLYGLMGCQDAKASAERWETLMRDTGLETRLSRVGVKSIAELERLAASVNIERLGNNPVRLDVPRLFQVLRDVY